MKSPANSSDEYSDHEYPDPAMPHSDRDRGDDAGRPLRLALFRLAGLLVVLSPMVLLEVILRLCVPAPAVVYDDPYISFAALRPLFVLDSMGERFETAGERLNFFYPQSFEAEKGANTFRAFCLGGSTVQGRPYAVETSFTTWLKLNLEAADANTNWEIVNCGGISYASYRLLPIMRELLDREPDLFIIYTGHNEFLEDRTYGPIKRMPRPLIRVHHVLLNLRSYSLAHRYLAKRSTGATGEKNPSKPTLPAEAQAMLDFEDGLKSYHRDRVWRSGTIEHFRRNIDTMVRMSCDACVPVILVNPVSNLKDCPPFKSQFRSDLSEGQIRQIAELRRRAGELDWADAYAKIELIEKAVAIDGRHAEMLYLLGKCYERIGRFDEAKKWFVKAQEEDVCPLRIIEPMRQAIRRAAEKYDAALLDVHALIEERTEEGIAGDEWLLDHVHPSITGHQFIAEALYQTMEDMGLTDAPQGLQTMRDELWRRHLSSLDDRYYMHGEACIRMLQIWSRGRTPAE